MINRKTTRRRIYITQCFFFVTFFFLCIRAIFIQIFPSSEKLLKNIATQQYQSNIKLSAYRGTIYDHRHMPLAISIKTPSIAVNPKVFNPNSHQIAVLQKILGTSKKRILTASKKNNYFAWLKRKIPHQASAKIKKLDIKGMHFLLEPARYYPGGSAASQVIGYVGTDNFGLLGLEQKYDKTLQGASSKIISLKDAHGQQILMDSNLATPEQTGHNLILTLDKVIQEITEDALKRGLNKSAAKKGFAIVMDPHTGRILAIANHPSFNPNNPSSLNNFDHTRNLAVSERFEPGSVMKPFIIAQAFEHRTTSPFDIHNCEKNGRYKVSPRNFIHDDHPKEFLTTEEVLINSSNICTFKIAEVLGADKVFASLKIFGFSNPDLQLNLPGVSFGSVSHWKSWSPIRFANISFGQGLLTTGVEIVKAYSVIANGGHLVNPYLVERIETATGETLKDFSPIIKRNVISKETSAQLKVILKKVVQLGTAKRARSSLYSTAGKTGTAEKIDPKTKAYSQTKRIASFAGFSPVQDPHLVAYVLLDEPGKKIGRAHV